MLRVVILGAAAGGGVPQWNCGCRVCRSARTGQPELQSTQASIAISANGEDWFLINASPDLRQLHSFIPERANFVTVRYRA
jgi:pyrroloquinoline quinone biosynthesis protein B